MSTLDTTPPQSRQGLAAQLFELAATCTTSARRAAENADALDEDEALAVKNWAGAALAATQAYMTVTRAESRR